MLMLDAFKSRISRDFKMTDMGAMAMGPRLTTLFAFSREADGDSRADPWPMSTWFRFF